MHEVSGPFLVFGGCYSNLQATDALLAEAARRGIGPRNMFCTGDIIAYGADAAATLRRVREAGIISIAGNCEVQLAAAASDCGCGFAPGSACDALAVEWYRHALTQVAAADREYMAALPAQITLLAGGRKICLVHGNAERINAFVFPSASNLELERQILATGCDAIIAGHSGIPFTRRTHAGVWHNSGSIGMPANDGTRDGWFSIVEVVDGEIDIQSHRLRYDVAAAARAMRRAGLPEGYAAALETGIWPSLDILPQADRLRTGLKLEDAPSPEPIPGQALEQLETLWVNTGTLCNITCVNCFMESSPTNDSLAYFKQAALDDLLASAPASLREIGFTGGEPFMNPDIIPMLRAVLASGRRALVLTNAMRPMQRHQHALSQLLARWPGQLALRVSLDHFTPARHEALRGAQSFAPTLAGLQFLARAGADISVAARTPWGETEAMLRQGFAGLFKAHDIPLDAQDAAQLILFPEMDADSLLPAVTAAALAQLPAEQPLMCATSRMVVLRRGAARPEVTPCTLLPDRSLRAMDETVALDHPHCARFCVFGGASCAGAPG
jgi:predicted phosphodiesterase